MLGKPNLLPQPSFDLLELVKVRMKDRGRKVPRLVFHHLIAPHRHLLEMKASTWDRTKEHMLGWWGPSLSRSSRA